MSYKVEFTQNFLRESKKLSKKYHSFKQDLKNLIDNIKLNPKSGKYLGSSAYKYRLAIKSKGKGKSGGARLIGVLVIKQGTVIMLTIYDKSNIESIPDNKLKELINEYLE